MDDIEHISSLGREVYLAIEHLRGTQSLNSYGAREKALEATRKLGLALTEPEDVVLNHCLEIPPLNMCVRLAISMGLFHIMIKQEPSATTSTELANLSQGNKAIIVRIMRILSAAGYVVEINNERYISTAITRVVIRPEIAACIVHRYDLGLPILATAPNFFKTNGFQPIVNEKDTPFQVAFQTDDTFHGYIAQRPDLIKNFHSYMKCFRTRSSQWMDWFPIQTSIFNGSIEQFSSKGTSDVLLVDVGGGQGQHVKRFRETFPSAPGRLVLQDLPQVIATLPPLGEGIDAMGYDMFTSQPVQGARVYYFHYILANWSDEECIEILRNTASAMTPGYSKLILNEVILPISECPWQQAALDIIMMSATPGSHRSPTSFSHLLNSAGLEVIKFWYPPGVGDGVIEAVRGVEQPELSLRIPTGQKTDIQYLLINDDIEYARLEDQAAGLSELMNNIVIHAPLSNTPTHLLDVGCGTGIVTCHLGKLYPNAKVYGVDLSPVPLATSTKPSNVEFIKGDIQSLVTHDPRFSPNSLDLVFHRLLSLGMTNWQGYVNDIASAVRPGGWLEMQDFDLQWYLNGKPCNWGWLQAVYAAAKQKRLDVRAGKHTKEYMERAGLIDIQVKEFRIPHGLWATDTRPETKRIGEHCAREYGTVWYNAISKMLEGTAYTANEIEAFRQEAWSTLGEEVGKEIIFFVTVGRKPLLH